MVALLSGTGAPSAGSGDFQTATALCALIWPIVFCATATKQVSPLPGIVSTCVIAAPAAEVITTNSPSAPRAPSMYVSSVLHGP